MTKFNLKPVCERFFSIMALIFCNKISLSNTLKVFHKGAYTPKEMLIKIPKI